MLFGKKRQVNKEINPIFILSPKTSVAAQLKDNQELRYRGKISILILCLREIFFRNHTKKQKKYSIFKKTQKKVDIR